MSEANIKKAVEKFYEIRNIPYHIPLSEDEENWDCEGKNRALAKELKKLGYKTRERIGLIRWEEQKLPKEILSISHENESSHTFIEVIPPKEERWIIVDPTWNPGLSKAGLPIVNWDGKSSTKLALNCYDFVPPEETQSYVNNIDYVKDLEINGKFYEEINEYCDSFLIDSESPPEWLLSQAGSSE